MVPKKVSESVSEKFGTEKSPGTELGKILVPKISLGIGIVQILDLVTHCYWAGTNFSRESNLVSDSSAHPPFDILVTRMG